ncbi:Pectinesterase 2 [Platanthera guangdongensis]|uniref:Pectinesterase n=1 Tax=Platanthera guangdongensis TaxID=2320717 RepID=A0ABR2MHX4_9ASPA
MDGAAKLKPSIFILFIYAAAAAFFVPANSIPLTGDINRWCRGMPHPASCRHYLSNPHSPAPPLKRRSDFYKQSVKAALDLAVHARGRLEQLGVHRPAGPGKTAWLDCCKLFENTVLQLNRTLFPAGRNCTALDSQTWLSAALTNLQTCGKGFSDLKADSSFIQPVMKYNLSDLISNCLALNNATFKATALPWGGGAARRKLLQVSASADFVVAKDGSGNFGTIKAALDAAATRRQSSVKRILVHVKAGVYAESLQIISSLSDLTMTGDGKGKTIITGSRSVTGGYTTFSSPTVSVFGDAFIAIGITIRNTFGTGSQAVALLSGSDRSVFYKCSIEGYQDTLCVYSQRQFYRECDIYGTIDFIFGNAAAVIQNCTIFTRTPAKGESNVITAQGRTDQNQNTGIVIQFCKIVAAPEFWPVHRTVKSYLGRPWQIYSRTLYVENFIDSIIDPAGWIPFNGDAGLDTLFYVEFRNNGPGEKVLRQRVKWKGIHLNLRPSQVRPFTVRRFIAGATWLPATGVPFASGL